jgi:hypothetical protein
VSAEVGAEGCGGPTRPLVPPQRPLQFETCQERAMSLRLHRSAYEYAQKLIQNRRCILDQPSDWTDHKPARSAATKFIETRGLVEFGRWHLGEDDEESENSKRRYRFPFGDFKDVHRCAVLVAESRAGEYECTDIEQAARHLHEMLDALMSAKPSGVKQHVRSF